MKLVFSQHAWDDYLYLQKTDRKTVARVNRLIQEICQSPYEGMGKPEALRHALAVYWSRRINDEHRIVYKVQDGALYIAQLRYHY